LFFGLFVFTVAICAQAKETCGSQRTLARHRIIFPAPFCKTSLIPYYLGHKAMWLSDLATRPSDFAIGRSHLATLPYGRDNTVDTATNPDPNNQKRRRQPNPQARPPTRVVGTGGPAYSSLPPLDHSISPSFHCGLHRRICASIVDPRALNLSLWTSLEIKIWWRYGLICSLLPPRWPALPTSPTFDRGLHRRSCASIVHSRVITLSLWTSRFGGVMG
jgi:hypothetical protein